MEIPLETLDKFVIELFLTVKENVFPALTHKGFAKLKNVANLLNATDALIEPSSKGKGSPQHRSTFARPPTPRYRG